MPSSVLDQLGDEVRLCSIKMLMYGTEKRWVGSLGYKYRYNETCI